MKYFTFLSLMFLTTGVALAQTITTNYEWKATMRVVDESGNPISGANANIGYFTNSQPANAIGVTDTNGLFTASHSVLESLAEVGLQADKPDYYTVSAERQLGPQYDPAQWTFTQTLVLKKVGKPIAMYAKKYVMGLNLPEYNKQIGYDFMIGDLVGPYGKGINSDIFFTENHADEKSGYTFTIGFPKEGDGIQEFILPDREMGSGLRSPHEAPVDGYQPKHEQTQMPNPNRIYLFRVRTAKDHAGNIVSAHYGKIYGDFMQFTYYLNPTPNDRNIEFDPKQNLLGGLQSFEGVNAP